MNEFELKTYKNNLINKNILTGLWAPPLEEDGDYGAKEFVIFFKHKGYVWADNTFIGEPLPNETYQDKADKIDNSISDWQRYYEEILQAQAATEEERLVLIQEFESLVQLYINSLRIVGFLQLSVDYMADLMDSGMTDIKMNQKPKVVFDKILSHYGIKQTDIEKYVKGLPFKLRKKVVFY